MRLHPDLSNVHDPSRPKPAGGQKYTPEQRFWSRIEMDTNGGCWLWSGLIVKPSANAKHQSRMPYGLLSQSGKFVLTHRFSYELHRGPIPEGLCVLHKCDIPQCVNPSHLFLGSYAENNGDMKKKGRARGPSLSGENHPNSRLTWDDVAKIRSESGLTLMQMKKKYGVSVSVLSKIRRGDAWREADQ